MQQEGGLPEVEFTERMMISSETPGSEEVKEDPSSSSRSRAPDQVQLSNQMMQLFAPVNI